jgi:hypothetical protein
MKDGTPEGSEKAIETKRKKYGDYFFKNNGELGGLARNLSGNAYSPFREKGSEYAKEMGRKSAEKRWGKKNDDKK